MNTKFSKTGSSAKDKNVLKADEPFFKYSLSCQTIQQKAIHIISMLLVLFGVLSISWALPFPYLKFLSAYNGFFNWSSFLIAIAVYCYYRMVPSLSFVVFVLFFALTYGVMQLADWQKAGGPSLLLVGGLVFLIGAALQFTNLQLKNKKPAFADWLKFMVISPMWVVYFLSKRQG